MKTTTIYTRNEPATGRQKRYITLLCSKLGIDEPLEERVMTEGEAGEMIRHLERRLEIKREKR